MQQRRPGFPARIAPSVPGGQRPAAVPAVQRPVSIPAPAGLGLDSAAVRARMVQRLAAGGVSSGAVLTAMGAVERHRFVDSAWSTRPTRTPACPLGWGRPSPNPVSWRA